MTVVDLQEHSGSCHICHRLCCGHGHSALGIPAHRCSAHTHCSDQRTDQLWTREFCSLSSDNFLRT